MKPLLKGILLVISILPLFIVTESSAQVGSSGRHILWGRGGLHWVIYENRQVYRIDDLGNHTGQGSLWDKKSVKDVFAQFDRLKFEKIFVNKTTGDYYIIKAVSAKGSHQVAWVNPSDLEKAKIRILYFYGMLEDFTK